MPEPGPATDGRLSDLLVRTGSGEQAAFAQLYDETADRLYGLIHRIVRGADQAEDILQESFVDIWRGSSSFDPTGASAIGWMLTIAHRRAVDWIRANRSATRRDTAYAAMEIPEPDPTGERVDLSLRAERLHTSLDELPSAQREVLQLAYFDGFTHREIASLLEIPLGTAKARIRQGLRRLGLAERRLR